MKFRMLRIPKKVSRPFGRYKRDAVTGTDSGLNLLAWRMIDPSVGKRVLLYIGIQDRQYTHP